METNPFRAARARQDEAARARREEAGGQTVAALGGVTGWLARRVEHQVWYYRLPLLLLLAWMYQGYPGDPLHTSMFDGVSLGFHEMGHAVFMYTGNRLLTVAGGTLFELGIPLVAALYLLIKQRDPFGALVCLFWMGTAMWGIAAYAGDARAQALPLVSPFGPVDSDSHDWTYLLMRFGRLSKDAEIARSFRTVAQLLMVGSLVAGTWVLWVMARHEDPPANHHR